MPVWKKKHHFHFLISIADIALLMSSFGDVKNDYLRTGRNNLFNYVGVSCAVNDRESPDISAFLAMP